MKKTKAILALLLALTLLVGLLAACGTSEENPPAASGDSGGSGDGAQDNIDYGDQDDEEMATIHYIFYDLRMTGADYGEHVVEAVNELTEAEINTHVDITFITVGDWATKAQLAIGSGEVVDVMQLIPVTMVSSLYSNGQLLDITDYLADYAPETMALMEPYLGPYTYGDRIYGLPTYRNYCRNGYLIMNQKELDEMGLTELAQNMTTWTELEQILASFTEDYGGAGYYAMGGGVSDSSTLATGPNFSDIIVYDNLGDALSVVYCDNDGNVSLRQAHEGYQYECAMVADWFNKGYVYPDSLFQTEHVDNLVKAGVVFASQQGSEYGVEVTKASSYGFDVVCNQDYTGLIKTNQLTQWGLGVGVTSEEPEAAVKFINMMYTSPELMNLLVWGVEGVDYEVVDGQVQQDPSGSGFYYQSDFIFGNNTLLTPLYGNGADFYEEVKRINESADISPFMGFALDTGELNLLMSQITAVTDEYSQTIQNGGYTEELYNDYLAKLESAGVQDYLDEIKTQLDAWQSSNG